MLIVNERTFSFKMYQWQHSPEKITMIGFFINLKEHGHGLLLH